MSTKPRHTTTKKRYGVDGRRRVAAIQERLSWEELREAVNQVRK